MDGNRQFSPKMNVNFVKLTTNKLIVFLCLALLAQIMILTGWKLTDTFKEKQKYKKNHKTNKTQKNYKKQNEKNSCNQMNGNRLKCDEWDGSWEINVRIWKNLNNWAPSHSRMNKIMKSYNGNGKNCVSLMHWNLGSKLWENKHDKIQLLVDQLSPDFLYISEANLMKNTPNHLIDIEGYEMTVADTMEHLQYSRIVLLSKVGQIFTVEHDRMNNDISSIWIKIGSRGKRSLRIGGAYRKHKYFRQPEPDNSKDQIQQERRWLKFISQWKSAGNSGPCVVIGDLNLDQNKWNTPEAGQENMVEMVKRQIETMNMHQMIQGPTRFWPGTQPSLIYHCWGNTIQNICNVKNVTRGTGDHNLLSLNYRIKGKVAARLETKMRDRRSFNLEELKRRLTVTNWSSVLEAKDVNIANTEFEDKFVNILNEHTSSVNWKPLLDAWIVTTIYTFIIGYYIYQPYKPSSLYLYCLL